jgi:NAD+ synthase (glutamine-hydrolysing)
MVDAYMDEIELTGLAEENLQARVRGTTLMAISNQENMLVLATGNKSELACGYSTLYGDAVGGYAPIKDIYKVDVWALSRWRNEVARAAGETPPIPVRSRKSQVLNFALTKKILIHCPPMKFLMKSYVTMWMKTTVAMP